MGLFAKPADPPGQQAESGPTEIPTHNRAPKRTRARRTRLSASEVDELGQRYVEGKTIRELAAIFGVHRSTVIGHLHARGISTRYRKLSDKDMAEAVKLRADGWSLARIGDRFGVQPSTVLNRLRRPHGDHLHSPD